MSACLCLSVRHAPVLFRRTTKTPVVFVWVALNCVPNWNLRGPFRSGGHSEGIAKGVTFT